MIRLTLVVLLTVAVLGCKGQDAQVPMDPFYGQTKIAPPGTGEISRRPNVDPYYPRSAAAPASPGGAFSATDAGEESRFDTTPTRLASSSGSIASDAGATSTVGGDRIEIPVSARREMTRAEMLASRSSDSANALPQRSADAAPSAVASTGSLRDRERIVQTLVPREHVLTRQAKSSSVDSSQPGPMTSRRGAVDINDLPPANRGALRLRDEHVQQASATEPNAQITVRIPTQVDGADSLGRFGYLTDYSRLRGRLEYLESGRCWKLRYIPIDGVTDDFGGSVIIDDTEALSGFERGDFVEVRGQLAQNSGEDSTDFAPRYRLTNIQSLEN